MNVPVLTYHSLTVQGSDYRDNDHVAFASDLRTITSLGYRVVSLDRVVRWHGDAILGLEPPDAGGTVAVSFDDGTDFDYHDLPHPTCGVQRSMLNLMRDFVAEAGPDAQPDLHGTSFVIASGEARSTLDRTCIVGKNWMRDSWWGAAVATGLLGVGNHSWTHNHPSLPVALRAAGGQGGSFRDVASFDVAEAEIATAAKAIRSLADGPDATLFAYPYGDASDYLVHEYFPKHGARIGVRAAFTCGATPVTERTNRWSMPRYVFGHDWRSPEDLVSLLHDAAG